MPQSIKDKAQDSKKKKERKKKKQRSMDKAI